MARNRHVETKCEAGTLGLGFSWRRSWAAAAEGGKTREAPSQRLFPTLRKLASAVGLSTCCCSPRELHVSKRFVTQKRIFTLVRQCCQVGASYPHRTAMRCNATSRVIAVPAHNFPSFEKLAGLHAPDAVHESDHATRPPPSLRVSQLTWAPCDLRRCDMSFFIVMQLPIVLLLR